MECEFSYLISPIPPPRLANILVVQLSGSRVGELVKELGGNLTTDRISCALILWSKAKGPFGCKIYDLVTASYRYADR